VGKYAAEVRDVIGAYVPQHGATLSRVTVVRLPDQRTGLGKPLAPGAFWP
jgi:hypothetical protein